jgi:hypothetical protein
MKPIARIFAILTLAALPAYAMDQAAEHTEHLHHSAPPMEGSAKRNYHQPLELVEEVEPPSEDHPEPVERLRNRSVKLEAEVLSTALLSARKPTEIRFRLTNNGKPLTEEGLETVHTKKLHALIVDPTLTDYQHLHPEATDTPGEYRVMLTPKTDRSYAMWLDLKPQYAPQSYLKLALPGISQGKAKVDKSALREATVGGYTFTLTFDDEIVKENVPAMGHLTVTDNDGSPVDRLQPVMGAFAHIVGFYGDRSGVAHMHPMGAEPSDDDARGGPTLDFHFAPKRKGFVKLFAQVNIDGEELFVPFGVEVK